MNPEDIHQQFQQYIQDAVEKKDPTRVFVAEVVQINPIEVVLVHTKVRIYSSQLVLTKNVMDYTVQCTYSHQTNSDGLHTHTAEGTVVINPAGTHTHTIEGTSTFIIHQGLQMGDLVTILQFQNANKYLILDKYYENEDYEPVHNL